MRQANFQRAAEAKALILARAKIGMTVFSISGLPQTGSDIGLVALAGHIRFSANHLAPGAGWCRVEPVSLCRLYLSVYDVRCPPELLAALLEISPIDGVFLSLA